MTAPYIDQPRTRSPVPRLVRSREDRVIAGVAGGLGRHLGMDPVILRIALVVLAFAGGTGLVAYLIAWLAIPDDGEGQASVTAPRRGSSVLVGSVLVGLGALLLLNQFLAVFAWRYLGPIVLIGLGLMLLARGRTPR